MLRADIAILSSRYISEWLISGELAYEILGEVVAYQPRHHLGNLPESRELLENIVSVLANCPEVPILALAQDLDAFAAFIFPSLLKKIRGTESSRKIKPILNWMIEHHKNPRKEAIQVFNAFIAIACDLNEFHSSILPEIKLLNQSKRPEWQDTKSLCDGSNNHSIDPSYLLNKDQRDILASHLNNLALSHTATQNSGQDNQINSEEETVESLSSNAQRLEEYFTPWLKHHVPSQAIGGIITLLAGSDKDVQQLAKRFLQRRPFADLRHDIVSKRARTRSFKIKINQGEVHKTLNLLGKLFEAPISTSPQDLKTIFVGTINSEIVLRKISISQLEKNSLIALLYSSFIDLNKTLNSRQDEFIIENTWQRLIESHRLDIEVAKYFILKNARYLLKNLGVKNAQIWEKIRKWDDYEFQLTDLSIRSHVNREGYQRLLESHRKFSSLIQDIQDAIANLIESDSNVQKSIFLAVRKKIGEGQYGYHPSNVPFEIFQNADDAVTEMKYLSANVDSDREYFVLKYETNRLVFMHWGRPINKFIGSDSQDQDLRDKGFDQDLVKMLSFNISDKPEDETGKFGLGFKTVYLVTGSPAIISGDLSFQVCGGILPLPISDLMLESLTEELSNEQANSEIKDGTLISLPLGEDWKDDSIILEFERQANLLLIFAKAIRKCKLVTVHGSRDLSWSPISVFNIPEIEVGDVHLMDALGQWEWHKILCFRLPAGIIAITLPKNLDSSDSPLQDISPFWVTTPTKEDSGLRFIINGNFDVTTGRTRLDPNSNHNYELIRKLGQQLGEKLCQLYQASLGENWPSLRRILGFEGTSSIRVSPAILKDDISPSDKDKITKLLAMANQAESPNEADIARSKIMTILARHGLTIKHEVEVTDKYKFWKLLWKIFVSDWLNKYSESISTALIEHGFGGLSQGFGYLINIHQAIPNELSGQLVRLQDVRFQVTGLLSKSDIFSCVSSWDKFKNEYPSEQLVSQKSWRDVRRLLKHDKLPEVNDLNVADCLKKELDNRNIDPINARSIGQIINIERMKKWESLEESDHKMIIDVVNISPISFMNQSGDYLPSSLLLLHQPEEPEEKRLVAFAPPDQILHPDYTDTDLQKDMDLQKNAGLQFFLLCRELPEREKIEIEVDELVRWARIARTESQQQGVLEYLSSGDRNLDFSSLLKESIAGCWMENDPRIQAQLKVKALQNLGNEAIGDPTLWDTLIDQLNHPKDFGPPSTLPSQPLAEPNQLKDIYTWWEENHLNELDSYNKRLYPIDITELQCRLIDDDRSAWLMLFFIGATHTMGRTTHEQHRDFIRFCLDKGWWDVFSSPDPQDQPDQWIEVLNSYIDSLNNDTIWYSWIEKYPNIYQISKYLDEYRESFCSADRMQKAFDLRALTNPRIASHLSRGGVDAPPLRIGIGANFVIRELVRLEILQENEYLFPHCFVPRANVRRVLTWLGCEGLQKSNYNHSTQIFKFLKNKIKYSEIAENLILSSHFDIPFELFSETSDVDLNGVNVQDDDRIF
jgi:hypothetical protein